MHLKDRSILCKVLKCVEPKRFCSIAAPEQNIISLFGKTQIAPTAPALSGMFEENKHC